MWAFQKRPQDLSDEEQAKVSQLFERISALKLPYHFRWRMTDIFASDISREEAASQLEEWRGQMDVDEADDQDHLKFFAPYDEPQSGILAYLDERRTSRPQSLIVFTIVRVLMNTGIFISMVTFSGTKFTGQVNECRKS